MTCLPAPLQLREEPKGIRASPGVGIRPDQHTDDPWAAVGYRNRLFQNRNRFLALAQRMRCGLLFNVSDRLPATKAMLYTLTACGLPTARCSCFSRASCHDSCLRNKNWAFVRR
jgi:hypothetical protein